jgi:DNA-binding winged helix-turn-helix (wHTH) protein/predicted ATPase
MISGLVAVENAVSARGSQEQRFGPFRLAGPNGPLHRGDHQVVALPPKPLALLWTLVRSAGEVVTKEQLLAAVWPGVVVTEGVISACLRDLRRALGDDPRNPRYIATAHRIGYRFMSAVTGVPNPAAKADLPATPPAVSFVGRQSELAHLHAAYAKAARGLRQLAFVTGEAGIGKTELVDVFLAQIAARAGAQPVDHEDIPARPRAARGQCVELYGAGEPFLPLLEALGRLCRGPDGKDFVGLLRRHAPTWLAQMPGLLDEDDYLALRRSLAGNTQDRMLREITGAIEVATAAQTLVLVLEDMHWGDHSSVDWLSMLVRRRESAHLLVIVTCRPVDLILKAHPLKAVKQDLVSRGAASEIVLGYLPASSVQAYVSQHVPGDSKELASLIHRRSQGHPLFMARLVESLLLPPIDGALPTNDPPASNPATARDIVPPSSVRELIEAQLAQLDPRQRATLDAASVAGLEFNVSSVAAGLLCAPEEAERRLEDLERHLLFIEARGLVQAPQGGLHECFGFRHDLYRETLYHCMGPVRKARLHARIAESLASAQGPRSAELASELAVHFERARNPLEAARYRREASEAALRRGACTIALAHVDKGLSLLAQHANQDEADPVELLLRLTQGSALLATEGFGGREVEKAYARAHELADRLDDRSALAPVLAGQWNLYLTRAAFAPALEVADQLYLLAGNGPDPVMSMLAHNVRAQAHLFTGAPAAALEHVAPCLLLYEFDRHRWLAVEYGEDPAVVCHHCAVLIQLLLGNSEGVQAHLSQGLELARRLDHPFSEAQMLWVQALVWRELGETARLDEVSKRLIALCLDKDFALWRAGGQLLYGVALAGHGDIDGAIAQAREGLQTWRESGTGLFLPYSLALLAHVYGKAGGFDEARDLIQEALELAVQNGEGWYEPELHRLRGELWLRGKGPAAAARKNARRCFERALALSRAQQAHLFEMRAAASLARLVQDED